MQRGRSRGRWGSSPPPDPPKRSASRSAFLALTGRASRSRSQTASSLSGGAAAEEVGRGGSARSHGGGRRGKRPALVVCVPKAATTLQLAPLLPRLMQMLPAAFVVRPGQVLAAAGFRCMLASTYLYHLCGNTPAHTDTCGSLLVVSSGCFVCPPMLCSHQWARECSGGGPTFVPVIHGRSCGLLYYWGNESTVGVCQPSSRFA